MSKVLILKGLPGSGKSTYARSLLNRYPGQWKRINKDDLRAMFDNGEHGKKNEKFILEARNELIRVALLNGYNVIVDDTNLNPKHEKKIKSLVNYHNSYMLDSKDLVEVEVKFLDTPIENCISQDLKRDKSVGERVIRRMYNQYLKPTIQKVECIAGLDKAIICDIDGTLAIMGNRSPFDWVRVGEDSVNQPIARLVNQLSKQYKILLFSGRDEVCREQTENWLRKNDLDYPRLYMRPKNDNRKDSIIKEEMFNTFVKGKYNVEFVLDDRQQVVDMWRSLGLTCLQVAEGDF